MELMRAAKVRDFNSSIKKHNADFAKRFANLNRDKWDDTFAFNRAHSQTIFYNIRALLI